MNIPLSELDTVLGYALPEDEKDKDKKPAPTAAAKPAPSMPAPGQANALPIGPQLPAPPRNVSLQDANTLPGMHQPTPHTTSVSPAEAQAPALPAPQAPALPGPASGIPTLQAPTKKESQAAGKLEYQEGLSAAPANAGVLPGDKVGADMATNAYEKKHPLGSDVSAKPGGWGKFEHGLSVAGNIAGDIVAPGIMEGIPGTDANKMLTERRDSQWEKLNAENSLKAAQTGQATAAAWKDYNNPGLLGKTNDEQDLAALMKTTNPDTGKPYTVDEANQHIKQQSQDVKPVIEQNQPVGDAGVPQHTQQLKTLEAGMTPAQAAQFEQAYSVLPTDSNAVANQRLENAKATAGMDAKERDLQTQRDIAAKNRQTQQGIAAGVHQDAENNLDATRGLESVQYVDKSGNLVSGSYNDAVAAGAEKTARKVSPEDDKTNRANYAQFGRWQGNIQKASDTMGAWDNKKDKDLAIQVLNNASASIHAGILNVDTEDLQNAFLNNADYAAMTPAGQAHMQNMFQLWSDAVNLMKVETGGVPRGEHFLKLESAILPQPEKTQAQNREALNQFSNRILQDTKGHVRPNDMDPVIPYDARAIRKDGQIVGYLDAKGKRQEF